MKLDDSQDPNQTIVVSTAENRLYVRRAGKTIFRAVCSTGKGTSLVQGGKTMVFETPTGKFRVVSKEENPVWVPPEWHYVEEARKKKKAVIRLNPGDAIDVVIVSQEPKLDAAVANECTLDHGGRGQLPLHP